MKLKIEKKYTPYFVISIVLIVSLLLSLVLFFVQRQGKRKMFIFPSADTGKYIVEYRYLPKKPVQGDINLFVDEILLGSGVERTKMLFTPGTKAESCFLRDGTLYVNLTADLLSMGSNVINIKDGIDLLKENIENNFRKVKKVEVFVDGKYAYESVEFN